MALPASTNGEPALLPQVETSQAAKPVDSATTTTEEVEPATISLPTRLGSSSPTPVIDALLFELGSPVVESTAGVPSGEDSRGRKPVLKSHIDLGVASKSPTPPVATLPRVSLDSGRPSPRSSFSGPSDYYKFPPAQSEGSSEAPAVVKTTRSATGGSENGVDLGKDTAASESTVKVFGECEKPAPTQELTVVQDPKAEGAAARFESEGGQVQQPPAPSQKRDPCRVMYATTCSCDFEDEEIARFKRKAPTPPPVLPRLLLPRAFSILKRCPSCDRWFETRSERDRVACVMEEHWACVVHLCLTGRIEAAFADE